MRLSSILECCCTAFFSTRTSLFSSSEYSFSIESRIAFNSLIISPISMAIFVDLCTVNGSGNVGSIRPCPLKWYFSFGFDLISLLSIGTAASPQSFKLQYDFCSSPTVHTPRYKPLASNSFCCWSPLVNTVPGFTRFTSKCCSLFASHLAIFLVATPMPHEPSHRDGFRHVGVCTKHWLLSLQLTISGFSYSIFVVTSKPLPLTLLSVMML
mmetsp:Transcript_11876/g.19128  ORF Transcript_11876/g.19128 Transcript_11876/m.19128 type:complete len:211 (+) Transcript_11876:101-733(+)